MFNNGASRCPVCHLEPLLTREPYSDLQSHYVLECPPHGYIAMGDTLAKVIEHWNKFVGYYQRTTAIQTALEPGPLNTSPCLFCLKDTQGHVMTEDKRYWVECCSCHLVKFERSLP
jgi:hypothetical protein